MSKKRDLKKVSRVCPPISIWPFEQKYKDEKSYDSEEEDDDFDQFESEEESKEIPSYDDEESYNAKPKKSKGQKKPVVKKSTKDREVLKIGKKRGHNEARKFIDFEAKESSDEEEEEFRREKDEQYYKPGELTKKTKTLNMADMEERYRAIDQAREELRREA